MIYIFDIDGTVCTNTNGDYDKAEPFQERVDLINSLYDDGHRIIFQTARGMGRTNNNVLQAYKLFYTFTKQQLDRWDIKYHDLFLGKPEGDLFIDNKGVRDEDFFAD